MMEKHNRFQEVSSRTIKTGVGLIFSVLLAGTVGYHLLEGMNFLDSLYMTVITISTVGFKEVGTDSLTAAGKVFTMGLIITSLGTLAYIGSNMARFVFD